MAQGAVKKTPKPSGASSSARAPKRGARVTKPKQAKSSGADKMKKKFAAGLVAKTEALLGERAGHLELIGQGKKGKKGEAEKKKGGSKKFG